MVAAGLRLDVMRRNPHPPRTAPATDLQQTLVGTVLVLGVFAALFGSLLYPTVGVALVGLAGLAVLARFGRRRLGSIRAARRSRRVRLGRESERPQP
jgi:hypothetical protein